MRSGERGIGRDCLSSAHILKSNFTVYFKKNKKHKTFGPCEVTTREAKFCHHPNNRL